MKKKTVFIVAFLVCAVAVSLGVFYAVPVREAFVQKKRYGVVVDAGHGGSDPGVLGVNGTVEAELNLSVSLLLQTVLESADCSVTMTRTTAKGLADEGKNFKTEDFALRKKVIREAQPDFVISIHTNKFPQSPSRRGIQVFFNQASPEGKRFAVCLQEKLNELNQKYVGKTYSALKGEYFMLNCTEKPSVIVECGFLSNAEDEKLLSQAAYRRELVESIYAGLIAYIG